MNAVLSFCWREWRAQRAVLLAYLGLVVAGLCLAGELVSPKWWDEEAGAALALTWFVAAGVVGVLAFVAPALVRSDFAPKDDQFVRRLPGALAPAFLGKLLFLGLTTLALPLLTLLAGEVYLQATGRSWHALFESHGSGDVQWNVPLPAIASGFAALLVPWVWAVGTWLPGGRMAVGGATVLVLVIALLVLPVLRQCPSLEQGIAWRAWLWAVAPLGLLVAAVSWLRGRRGGGPARSARVGLLATIAGLLAPAAWLGDAAWRYQRPDPARCAKVWVGDITADLRHALLYVSEHESWQPAPFRVDLATGDSERLGSPHTFTTARLLRSDPWSGQSRWWRVGDDDTGHHTLLDLTTGERSPLGRADEAGDVPLPADVRDRVLAERFAASRWRAPDGRRLALLDGALWRESADGTCTKTPWPRQDVFVAPAGHGLETRGNEQGRYFDADGREVAPSGAWTGGFAVRERWLLLAKPDHGARGVVRGWQQREPDGAITPCDALRQATVLGLADDDRVLAAVTSTAWRAARLFLYRPADRTVTELAPPAGVAFQVVSPVEPVVERGSLLPRDGAGRVWVVGQRTGKLRRDDPRNVVLCVDPAAGTVERCGWQNTLGNERVLGWPDAESVLVDAGSTIDGVDLETGARTRLFPRALAR